MEIKKQYYKEAISAEIFQYISQAAKELEVECYVIGGFVRDFILKRGTAKDIDIVAVGSGIKLAQKVASLLPTKPKVQVFKTYGTAMLRYQDIEIEFVGARKESYTKDSRNPEVSVGTLQDDQNRRDFTINALALSLNEKDFGFLLDPFGGMNDLVTKTIRTPLAPDITYSDDPLRMMRAIRFATQLNFSIEEESLKAITENAKRIDIITRERIIVELHKIISAPVPSIGFLLLEKTNLLKRLLPELVDLKGVEEVEGQKHKDNFYHTLEVVDNISKNTHDVWLRWAALLHDIGKAPTKKFHKKNGWTFHAHEFVGAKMVYKLFKRLKMPLNNKMKFVQKMVLLSSRPIVLASEVTDSAVRRLIFDAGDDVDSLMTLCEADITTKNPKKFKRYHQNFELVRKKIKEVEERDRVRNFQPPISGEEIMKTFNLKPCREIGQIKEAIKEAILEGEILNEYEASYQFMLKKGKSLGLKIEA
ncbi:HD domain-containing protein [Tenacibaculum maritimum]|uniref:Multifunctional CCA protein n=1 Tax=Tenacibaculum maritimum NCIMB 2154 TaxID=1349785 RepID=A0A2H1E9D7_9FLAO|nr:HD domain-containing protein [Tenacibaculum maritimum]MCD9584367.1 CCA tRNA nucleotidyltransferase [Tenacibaculum maritimum]MCD9609613.1 CCA tRNA nucleotidyltransferase [Tenacibaculum maritimum]MCD9620112.1 CCA tRNA nucleotidyltransferase [Tenacibaculum maritimum]MCD9626239.1 CCA tRNA nucleotidyltransferase [Tenacibaculum maritimum]MCD9630711.1 CCA tRNA nucleotidyltransferase [Tenacibaculum maritimum]